MARLSASSSRTDCLTLLFLNSKRRLKNTAFYVTFVIKVFGLTPMPSAIWFKNSIHTLGGNGCYFFLSLWLSMYVNNAKTTSNRVKTSSVLIGHSPFQKLEGIYNRSQAPNLYSICNTSQCITLNFLLQSKDIKKPRSLISWAFSLYSQM